jgi:putative membrane protein
MKKILLWILKGMGMGAANVIPGVSGGTIALITGIFERLINAIKSFDLQAAKLLFKLEFSKFAQKVDLRFVLSLLLGIVLAILSLARLFDFLFIHYPVYIWAYFFGLVLASVYFVGKRITNWKTSVIISFLAGTGIAIAISLLHPTHENDSFLYLLLCGIVAIISMILPGLSGSFILILMGNYRLVVIDAINNFNLDVLLPVGIGAVLGLIAFSHILSWLFKHFADQTLAILTGFILGSLSVLWPWQKAIYLKENGDYILKHGEKIVAYTEKIMPANFDTQVIFAFGYLILGIISIYLIERFANQAG